MSHTSGHTSQIREALLHAVDEAVRAANYLKEPHSLSFIEAAAEMITAAYRRGNKLLLAGNGGSLCDAMHFAEELTGRFRKNRPALGAIALADSAHLTCVGNDFGFVDVFARGVEALGKEGDILVILTTSGNSPNLIAAVAAAKRMGLKTLTFLGRGGGKLKGSSDLEWCVDGFPHSDRVQEAHMAAIHIMLELIEEDLFHEP